MEWVFPMIIWSEFRMMQYRDDDHREDTPHLSTYNSSIATRWCQTENISLVFLVTNSILYLKIRIFDLATLDIAIFYSLLIQWWFWFASRALLKSLFTFTRFDFVSFIRLQNLSNWSFQFILLSTGSNGDAIIFFIDYWRAKVLLTLSWSQFCHVGWQFLAARYLTLS